MLFQTWFLFHAVLSWMFPCMDSRLDPGFDLFFASNTDEIEDAPIYFDKPPPQWMHGTLIRNGLGRFELGDRTFTHTFDAFAKLSSWKFAKNGSTFFSTKFLETDMYKESVAKKTIAPYLLFESVSPPFNEFEKMEALVRGIDNMNVNVHRFIDEHEKKHRYVALSDFWKLYEFEPHSLNTTKSIHPSLPRAVKSEDISTFLSFMSSAHPLPEYGSPYHITFLSSVSLTPWVKSKITLVRIKSAEKREEIAHWDVDRVPYMHSFSLTKNYAIIFASPFYINVPKMAIYAEPIDCIDWYSNEPTTVYVIELKTGKVRTLKTVNVFTMHHINAFEESKSQIVMDISAYRNPGFVKSLQVNIVRDPKLRNNFDAHAMLQRYYIDLTSGSIKMVPIEKSREVPYASYLDLPTINEHYRYSNYCYVYGVVLKSDDINLTNIALVKKDLCNKTGDKAWRVENHYPVEGWFVPTPGGLHEDDGYIIVPVLDGEKGKSYLSIIDARTMNTTSTAYLPTIIPFNLHGRFFDDLL